MNDSASFRSSLARHQQMANAIRALAMDAVEAAKSGHPGMPMGAADIATVLFANFLKFDPQHPDWPDRDRFVLSAGHGSMLLYSLLHLTGYPAMTIEELRRFRQLGSRTAGHPEYGLAPGIETTTGPLGQGLANAVGMALAERLLNARFGDALVDHYTYVIAGDGCLMEGISHEAISLAGHLRLGKLIVLWDDNRVSIDGSTDLAVADDQLARFRACGWDVQAVDGHQPGEIYGALARAKATKLPSFIACRTTIGYGAPTKAGTAAAHGAPLGVKEIEGARAALGWPYPPFEVPEEIVAAWRQVGLRGTDEYRRWRSALEVREPAVRAEFARLVAGRLPENWQAPALAVKRHFAEKKPRLATRQTSKATLDALVAAIPEMVGGSADLTGSNGTLADGMATVSRDNFAGRYIHYGVREHAMAAVMNGMALHKGVIPYGGTFLIFTDYCRPAIRLAALMHQRVVFVMTHDSIGLGEDGPTHQPVEQLAGLRAIPNLNVFRPADGVETVECWMLALESEATPSVLSLTRQALPTLRANPGDANLCAKGAYVLAPSAGERRVSLLASGSEVEIALAAQKMLESEGIGAAVVSMPCWRLFDQQPEAYRREVLGQGSLRIAIEAAAGFGWERYLGSDGIFIGMHSFGASGPYDELYKHFGITADAVVSAARARLMPLGR
ncbi:MAG TPA: transketolase [Alphaproteobacteria bacterium]|nr:transketolase [Alphaproteobacteria bacterium]